MADKRRDGFQLQNVCFAEKRPGVCLEAVLQLEQKEREAITAQMQQNKDYRKILSRIQAPAPEAYSEIRCRIMPETSLKKRD